MAGIKAFKKISQSDKQAAKFQDNVEQALVPVLNSPLLGGVLLKGTTLLTGQSNLVEHKLSREPLGWFIVRKRASAIVWDEQDNNTFKKKSIDFRCSADVVVDLYIF